MKIGRVVGTVVSTINSPIYEDRRLLLCDLLDDKGQPTGGYTIGIDVVDAGAGEVVLIIDEGNSARQLLAAPDAPARAVVVALKATKVRPGMQVVERYYGLLEVHSEEQAETRAAGAAILEEIGHREEDRRKPKILSSQVIRHLDGHQCQLINRMRWGQMIIPGQTLYVLEVEPAAYAALAANEAEKAAEIRILEVGAFGSLGRVYLGGEERDIDVGWRAAHASIEALEGRVEES